MKVAYRWLAGLIAVGVVVQAAAIATGVFNLAHEVDNGATITKDWDGNAGLMLHGIMGEMIIPLLAIALLIVGFIAKIPSGAKWAGMVFGAVLLQIILAFISFGAPIVGVLHGINALAVLTVAILAERRAYAAITAEATAPAGASTVVA